jgi:electron transport complex protein RnfD
MKLIVSSPPHWHKGESVAKIHFQFIIALLPALIFAIYTYGFHAARVVALSVVTAMISDIVIRKLFKRPITVSDGSAILIGLLFAFLLPPNAPFWLVIAGSFICILIGKEIFGGLGCNPLNPVLVGWAITRISWVDRFDLDLASVNFDLDFSFRYPLTLLKGGGAEFVSDFNLVDLFLGKQVGGIGSIAIFLLLIGGIFLLLRKVITWEIPASFTLGVLFMATIFWIGDSQAFANPLFHLFTGNVMLGIFFLSTDFSSSPFNRWGMIIFGFGCGFLTIILRVWSNYPDGVIFAIIIMNLFTPLLDKIKKKPISLEISRLEKKLP